MREPYGAQSPAIYIGGHLFYRAIGWDGSGLQQLCWIVDFSKVRQMGKVFRAGVLSELLDRAEF